MTWWIAVHTGMRDERGEDVFDPVYTLPPALVEAGAFPRVGEMIASRGRRFEVVQVVWSLNEESVTFIAKPED